MNEISIQKTQTKYVFGSSVSSKFLSLQVLVQLLENTTFKDLILLKYHLNAGVTRTQPLS